MPDNEWQVAIGDETVVLGVVPQDGGYLVQQGEHRWRARVVQNADRITVFADGRGHAFGRIAGVKPGAQPPETGGLVVAPMPGLVKLVAVADGQRVAKGDALLMLEAMKMEHTLSAPCSGLVAEILVAAGDQVSDGTLLVRLEPGDG